jgi:hypothetical protein
MSGFVHLVARERATGGHQDCAGEGAGYKGLSHNMLLHQLHVPLGRRYAWRSDPRRKVSRRLPFRRELPRALVVGPNESALQNWSVERGLDLLPDAAPSMNWSDDYNAE